MISMTGFASSCLTWINDQGQSVVFSCILKSINNRYFEITCKMPSALQLLEIDIINRLRPKLIRGKCTLIIQCSDSAALREPLKPSLVAVGNYLRAAQEIQATYGIAGSLSIADLIRVPELFSSTDSVIDDAIKIELYKLLDSLSDQLMQSRRVEGAALLDDIVNRLAKITEAFEALKNKAQENLAERQRNLVEQLQALELNKEADLIKYQLTNECKRSDVTEELVRFASHFNALEALITNDVLEKGRQLDFIIQELGRETNTIAAKSSDAYSGSLVITLKVELEKIREQIQNII